MNGYQEQNNNKENEELYVTVGTETNIYIYIYVLGCTIVTGLKYIVMVCIRTNDGVLMIDKCTVVMECFTKINKFNKQMSCIVARSKAGGWTCSRLDMLFVSIRARQH